MTESALMEPPASPPTAVPTGPLANLILARLLPAKASVAPKKLRDDLSPLFRNAPSTDGINEVLASLRVAGLVTPKGQQLTVEGRTRALGYLGVTELPPKANWGTVKAKYLVPKALGLPLTSGTKTYSDANNLAAFLLKRKHGLPVGTGNGLSAVFEAIACQQLGYPDHTKLRDLLPHLLSKAIGSKEPLTMSKGENVARVLLDAPKPGMEGLRAITLAELTNPRAPSPIDPTEPFDLETFANTVLAVARKSPSGRFGDNKVFINHVWRQAKDEPQFPPLSLPAFKEKLIEANRENLLTLSRADMYEELPANDLDEAETAYQNAVFHFILLEKQ